MSASRLSEVTEKWNVLTVYELEELLLEIAAALQAGAFETASRSRTDELVNELSDLNHFQGPVNSVLAKQQLARAIWIG